MSDLSVWVVIAAYNEGEMLAEVLRELIACDDSYNIIIVDDGSTDNTSETAEKFNVHVLRHPINLGQGAALATGFRYALKNNADVVVTFDGDGQMSPQNISSLLTGLQENSLDVALGSRFLECKPIGIKWTKKLLLKMAVILTVLTTGLKLTDTHNGLRAIRASALAKMNITQNRMSHASEILSEISRNKLSYCEVPVTIRYTEYSKTKGQSIFNSFNVLYEMFTGEKK